MEDKELTEIYAKIRRRDDRIRPSFEQLLERSKVPRKKKRNWYAIAATIGFLAYISLGSWLGISIFEKEEPRETISISNWESPTNFVYLNSEKQNTITEWKATSDFSKEEKEIIMAVSNWKSPTEFLLSN